MSVRLEAFSCRGIGPFAGGFSVDLSTLSPSDRLVAIVGENGAGKTTFLEVALPGCMWRMTPTRGSLVSLATSREAFAESRLVVNGERFTLRHLVDGQSGKSEALALDGNGAPLLPDTKVKSFDAWAAKHLPAPEVFFASVFAAQASGGFLGAKPSARKDVLLLTLGPEMERLEACAVEARERLKSTKAELATVEARIADERLRRGDVGELGNACNACALEADLTSTKADRLARELDLLKVAALRRDAAEADAAQLAESRATLRAELDAATAKLEALEVRIRNNRAALERATEIRAAAVEAGTLEATETAETAERARLAETSRALTSEAMSHGQEAARGRERVAEETARASRLTAALEQAPAIAAAGAELPAARAAVEAASELVREAEAELERLRGEQLAGAAGRIVKLRGGLETIRDLDFSDIGAPSAVASDTINADDTIDAAEKSAPARRKACEQTLAERRAKLTEATAKLSKLEALAARAGEVEANRTALVEASASVERWKASAEAAERRRAEQIAKAEAVAAELAPLEAARETRRARLEALAPLLRLAKGLGEAETRLAELMPIADETRRDVQRHGAALAALPEPVAVPARPDVEGGERDARAARQAADEAAKRLAQAEQRLEQASASSERLALLEVDRATTEAELADWTRLAADLGKDGLQAMVIDGAIPELNLITNELLHAAFGTRWTIDVRTQTADAKGRRLLETLDVWFVDTERGREGLAETLSGGEKTIVAEALSLALTAIACRQAGADRPTLIRDESAGQLSPGKTRAWIEMMRRAADIIGADRILFVNHNPETWDLADARIEVRSAGAAA